MILVVSGPTKSMFARLVANIVTNGINALRLFVSASTPDHPADIGDVLSIGRIPG
jgi:hypothetical protein